MGGGAGRLKGGRHLKYADKPTMANLLVTLMDKMDVPVEQLGGSTGKLPLDTLPGSEGSEQMQRVAGSRWLQVSALVISVYCVLAVVFVAWPV